MKLVGYVRVSRVGGREGESFISPQVQREQVTAWAKLRGVQIAGWCEDLDVSGGTLDRDALNEALRMVRDGRVDGLAVATLDRLSRADVGDALAVVKELHDAGGTLAAIDLGVDPTTPFGEFAMTVMLALGRMQRRRISDSWLAARERAVARGVHVSSATPTGYVRQQDGRLQPHPEHAPVITRAFALRASGGSWREVADLLEQHGVRGPYDASHWTNRAVAGVIGNRVYLGEARSGEFVKEDAHHALTDPVTWQRAQAPRGVATERTSRSSLSGLLRCAGCRFAMKPDTVRMRDGRRERTYRCRGNHSTGRCMDRSAVMAHLVEEHVEALFLERVGEIQARAHQSTREVDALRDELRRAQHALAVFRDDPRILDAMEPAVFADGLRARSLMVAEARERLAEAEEQLQAAGLPVAELRAMWPSLTAAERRQVLAAGIDAVMLRSGRTLTIPGRVVVLWRGDAPADLPRRGLRVGVRPFVWPEEAPLDLGVASAEDVEKRGGGG